MQDIPFEYSGERFLRIVKYKRQDIPFE